MHLTKTELKNVLQKVPTGVKLVITETLATGEFVVTADKVTKDELIAKRFPTLVAKPITLSDAAKKYTIPIGTLKTWVYRNNYFSPIDDEYPQHFSEADIAYCADIYHQRKQAGTGFFGAPLLDDDGLPYELKHPDLAQYRKQRKSDA